MKTTQSRKRTREKTEGRKIVAETEFVAELRAWLSLRIVAKLRNAWRILLERMK